VQGHRLGQAEERQGPARRSWRSCSARTCSRKHGSPRRRCGSSARCCGTGLRWVLNQAAQTAKRSPQFAASYSSIAKRRGKKIATIAIARKLLTRACHLLAGMPATGTTTPPRRP